jgi:type I restriction enzyme S subunit
VPLSHLIEDISAGKSFGAANAPARDGEWGIIKVSAMTWGQFDPSQNKAVTSTDRVDPRFEIREGDLLVSRANTSEYVGASVLVRHVRPKLLLSDKSLRLTPRAEVESEWLWRALQAPSARRQISAFATGTKDSMRNISQAALKRVLLPNVSNDEQAAALKSFNEVADAVALLRRETATGAQRLGALRRTILAAAFSGTLAGAWSDLSPADEMIGA